MKKTLGLIGLLGLGAISSGCFEDSEEYQQWKEVLHDWRQAETSTVLTYADSNNDGLISEPERMELYGKIAEANQGKYVESMGFYDSEGKHISDDWVKEDMKKLTQWFKSYKPTK